MKGEFWRALIIIGILGGFVTSLAEIGYGQPEAGQELQPLKLEGTEWGIDMYPLETAAGQGAVQVKDVILFWENKFTTKSRAKRGFNATNYTLSVKHDGTTVCETMQSKAKETVFWRLEMSEDGRLRGVASIHAPDGAVSDYRIGGRLWSGSLGERVIKKAPPKAGTSGTAILAKKGRRGAKKAIVGGQPRKSLWQRILAWFRRKRGG
jgi:hypothetical protein